jgi:hypothetical protein
MIAPMIDLRELAPKLVRLRHCAGPFYFDVAIIRSTIFDSSLRSWEWHKGKKHRHPHPHLNLLPAKPVDA